MTSTPHAAPAPGSPRLNNSHTAFLAGPVPDWLPSRALVGHEDSLRMSSLLTARSPPSGFPFFPPPTPPAVLGDRHLSESKGPLMAFRGGLGPIWGSWERQCVEGGRRDPHGPQGCSSLLTPRSQAAPQNPLRGSLRVSKKRERNRTGSECWALDPLCQKPPGRAQEWNSSRAPRVTPKRVPRLKMTRWNTEIKKINTNLRK